MENREWDNISSVKTILSSDTIVKPFNLTHLLPFGTYRLNLEIAAANAAPVSTTVEINLTGDWFGDQVTILREGVGVRIV